MKLKVIVNEWGIEFLRPWHAGKRFTWRHLVFVGNASIGMEFVAILNSLKIEVEIQDNTDDPEGNVNA